MNFKTFTEAVSQHRQQRSRKIDIDQAKSLIKQNASQITDYYKGHPNERIYRGYSASDTASYLIEPTKFIRQSRNTSNYYTLLIDTILNSWTNYPKRSQSIICTTEYSMAQAFGYPFVVFPYNNAKIAICKTADFWQGFEYLKTEIDISGMDSFNQFIIEPIMRIFPGQLFTYAFNSASRLMDEDPEWLRALIGGLDWGTTQYSPYEVAKKSRLMHKFNNLIEWMLYNKQTDFIKAFDILLNPEKNKFKLQQLPKINLSANSEVGIYSNEVWTDANSILVPVYEATNIIFGRSYYKKS